MAQRASWVTAISSAARMASTLSVDSMTSSCASAFVIGSSWTFPAPSTQTVTVAPALAPAGAGT